MNNENEDGLTEKLSLIGGKCDFIIENSMKKNPLRTFIRIHVTALLFTSVLKTVVFTVNIFYLFSYKVRSCPTPNYSGRLAL